MKKVILLCLLLMSLVYSGFCQDAYIDYLEGEVFIRDTRGFMTEAFKDDELDIGYTVLSGPDGLAEIYYGNTLIRMDSNTVFQLLDAQEAGKKTSVFSCVVGSVLLKVESITEDQLDVRINTPSANCGVRGTVFRVFSGADGSSLVAVEEGVVEVESKGVTVALEVEEGVEVIPGETPGEKFTVLRGELDFSAWDDKKFSDVLDNPLTAVMRVETRLNDFIEKLKTNFNAYTDSFNRLTKEREKLFGFTEEQKKEKNEFYKSTILPLEVETSNLFLNVRYYALSALSLRRYVLGRMYIMIKTNSIKNIENQVYRDFLAVYRRILSLFETEIVPHLVEADI
ncbi:MAG: FecR domain-containing protein [Spirochaetales bacterium]|nr:FecR domain-containing protein [Spirochaetales bacterium]